MNSDGHLRDWNCYTCPLFREHFERCQLIEFLVWHRLYNSGYHNIYLKKQFPDYFYKFFLNYFRNNSIMLRLLFYNVNSIFLIWTLIYRYYSSLEKVTSKPILYRQLWIKFPKYRPYVILQELFCQLLLKFPKYRRMFWFNKKMFSIRSWCQFFKSKSHWNITQKY